VHAPSEPTPEAPPVGAQRSAECSMLLGEVRRFSRRHLDAAAIERAGRVPEDVVRGLADLGLFGMALPVEHGGAGLTLRDACAVIAELATWDRSVATMVGLHTGLGTRGIVAHGVADVTASVLPRLATGEWIGAFAATEASAGSDLMAVRTTARLEGDTIALDGEKSYVTNGRIAGCYTVLARTGARGHALVLVPKDTPGLGIGAEENKLGIRASSTVTVSFADVRVPASHLLGSSDRGLEAAYAVLSWGRTLMASGCVGTMRAALDASVAHVTSRRQFRRLLGDFSAVKTRVADQVAMLFATEALVDSAATALDRGDPAEALTMAVKVFASERAFEACDGAIQLHGALGVLEDAGVARLLRDCRVTRIFEGANDVLLLRIAAARLTGRARTTRLRARYVSLPDLAEECDSLAEHLDAAADALRAAYGAAIVGKQGVLIHLGRAEVAHLAAVAAVVHATKEDDDTVTLAVRRLLRDATGELDALADTTDVERVSARVADRLYAAAEADADGAGQRRAS